MLDKNLSTILRLPLRVGADSPDTQDTFRQQHGGNSMSNSTSLTQVQPGRTCWPCVEPQIVCTLDVHAPAPGVQCRLLSYLCTQQALFTWWWISLTRTHTCSHHNKPRCDLHLPTADQSSLHLPSDNLGKCNILNNWTATYPKYSFN